MTSQLRRPDNDAIACRRITASPEPPPRPTRSRPGFSQRDARRPGTLALLTTLLAASLPVSSLANPPTLHCHPAELRHGDTLTLTMTVPHGGDIVIVGPDRHHHQFVCAQEATATPGYDPEPLHPFDACRALERINLVVGVTPISAWGPIEGMRYGGYRTQALARPGTYLIHVSDGFGLRPQAAPLSCTVQVREDADRRQDDEARRRQRVLRDLGLE